MAASGRAAAAALDLAGLARFDAFALPVGRGHGVRPGERRLPGRTDPAGAEVESYAAYVPGDDLRHVDWHAAGRFDTLLVRRFVAEREVLFHLLLDVSASMDAPPADGKLAAARALTAALAYVALGAGDACRLALLSGTAPVAVSPPMRQRRSVLALGATLAGAEAAGTLELAAALEEYGRRHPGGGAALLVSDLMIDPSEVERGVRALQARRFEVHLLQVVGASEMDPGERFTRGVLVDVESGASRAMVLTAAVAARYRDVLARHLAALAAVAERCRCTYARFVAGTDLAAFVAGELAGRGLVRRR